VPQSTRKSRLHIKDCIGPRDFASDQHISTLSKLGGPPLSSPLSFLSLSKAPPLLRVGRRSLAPAPLAAGARAGWCRDRLGSWVLSSTNDRDRFRIRSKFVGLTFVESSVMPWRRTSPELERGFWWWRVVWRSDAVL
jgi:hypothetical protein